MGFTEDAEKTAPNGASRAVTSVVVLRCRYSNSGELLASLRALHGLTS